MRKFAAAFGVIFWLATSVAAKPDKGDMIFLDVFEVKVKKEDTGLRWDPKFYVFSQNIGFDEKDDPKKWTVEWYREIRDDADSH